MKRLCFFASGWNYVNSIGLETQNKLIAALINVLVKVHQREGKINFEVLENDSDQVS